MTVIAAAPGSSRGLPSWERLSAAALDFVVLAIPQAIVAAFIVRKPWGRLIDFLEAHSKAKNLAHNATFISLSNRADTAFFHFLLIAEALTAIYLIGMYLGTGSTLGKLALGLRITRVDGSPMSPRDAVLRSLVFWVPLLLSGIGIGIWIWLVEYVGGTLVILFRPDRRGFEDLLGRTIVVRRQDRGRPLSELLPGRTVQVPPERPPVPGPGGGGYLPGWGPPPVPTPDAGNGAEDPE